MQKVTKYKTAGTAATLKQYPTTGRQDLQSMFLREVLRV
jgi:hypothetical protein